MASVVDYLPISLVSLLYMVVWFASPICRRVVQGRIGMDELVRGSVHQIREARVWHGKAGQCREGRAG
jgi:hypothetical protein